MSWTSIIALALLALAAGAPALAEEAQAPQQCWAPQALAGTEAELKHVHSRQSLDLAPLKQATLPPATAIAPELRGSIRSVELPPGEKLIALTFDLCEENGYVSGYDGRVVDFLRVQGIKATFFAGGKWMETHPERAQQLIADPLFEIGSHGLRHLDLSHAKEQTLAEEITLTEAAYARARTALTARQRGRPPGAAAMTTSPFSAIPIELEATGSMPACLLPLDQRSCASLAAGIVAMEPWSVMNYPADKLAAFLASPDAGAARYVVSVKGEQSGVVSVRHPWLKGPYLELLALLPEAQNHGIGSSIMAWFESAGLKHGARNLWVCASSFNARALRFYERHGFARTATLPGLVADGYDEVLLRKFPLGPQS